MICKTKIQGGIFVYMKKNKKATMQNKYLHSGKFIQKTIVHIKYFCNSRHPQIGFNRGTFPLHDES